MNGRTSPLLAGVFLVGAVVGGILGWMGRARIDDAREGSRPEPMESSDADGTARSGAGRGPAGAATPLTAPSAGSTLADGAVLLAAGTGSGTLHMGDEVLATGTATLVVTMKGAPPEVASSATVYILPAGGPGVDDASDVPYGAVGASIVVPAPATYDVGVCFDVGHADFSLARDVHVEIGESRSVDVSAAVTVRRPIHMRLGPGSRDHVPPGAIVAVTWSRTGLRGRGFPGRREAMDGRPNVTTRFDPRTETDTAPLADDGPWHATAGFEEVPVGAGGPLEIAVVPRLAKPGDTVEIRIEPMAVVRVEAARPDGDWPEGMGPLHLAWEGAGRPASCDVRDLDEIVLGVGLRVAPGRGRVAWSGPGIHAGSSAPLEAKAEAGGVTNVRIPLDFDPTTVGHPARLLVHVRRADAPSHGDDSFWIGSVRLGSPDAIAPEADWGNITGETEFETEFEMEPGPSREVLSLVVVHGACASEVVTARGAGTVEIDLHPGGYLVVLPAGGASTGAATAERLQGGLIPFAEKGFDGRPTYAAVRVPLAPGRVLGPFPEGPLRLRLRRGGIAVADVTVTVRAGAFEPLRLPK